MTTTIDPAYAVIQRLRCELTETVSAECLFPFLQSRRIICDEETQEIGNRATYATRQSRMNRLIDYVEKRECGSALLIAALEEKYPLLHEKLLSQCVDTLLKETSDGATDLVLGVARHALEHYRRETRNCDELQANFDIANEERAVAIADYETLESDFDSTLNELHESRAQCSRLISEKETAWSHRDRVQDMNERLQAENKTLRKEIGDATTKLRELVVDDDNSNRLSSCDELIRELRRKIAAMETEILSLKTKSRRVSTVSGASSVDLLKMTTMQSPPQYEEIDVDCGDDDDDDEGCDGTHGIELSVTTTVKGVRPHGSCKACERLHKGDIIDKIGTVDLEPVFTVLASHFLQNSGKQFFVRRVVAPPVTYRHRHVSGQSSRSSLAEHRHSRTTSIASGTFPPSGFRSDATTAVVRTTSMTSLPDSSGFDDSNASSGVSELCKGLSSSLPMLNVVGQKPTPSTPLIRQIHKRPPPMAHSAVGSSCKDGGCSMFIRTLFNYGSRSSDEHGFEPLSVFRVVRKEASNKRGFWEAYSVDRSGKDKPPSKFIPNLKAARRLKSNLHAVQNTLKKKLKTAVDARKSRRKDMDWESPDDDDDSDDAGLVLGEVAGYEEVQPIMVHYARPVILLGMLTSQVAEALLRFPCGMKFLRSSSTGNDLRKFAEEGHHFVMEYNSSSVIEQLENVEGLHPIVIFLTAKSRKLSKPFPGGLTKDELEVQFKKADELRLQHGAYFSGTIYVEPTTEMDVYAGKICEVIREEQKSVVWQKISASS